MAATSCLYHTLGLAGYDHPRTEYRAGCVYLHVQRQRFKRQCRSCGARWDQLTFRGRFRRTILTLPVGRKRQYVVVRGHRQRCRKCGGIHREPIPFVTGKRRCSNVFAQYVIELCRIATLEDVALFLGVGRDLIKEIHKEYLGRRWKRRKFGRLRYLFRRRVRRPSRTCLHDGALGPRDRPHRGPGRRQGFACPHPLKEQLRVLWNIRSHASVFLDNWIRQAQSIGNSFFATLADTLEGHREGLLAHFDHPLSSGPLEGLNNKIKVLKRRACGFRDMAYIKLRLYFLHERMERGERSPFAG